MLTFLTISFLVICVLLILLVLVQDPKGGSSGMFGGGGGANSLFGATGAPTFISKLTRNIAILFGVMCIVLTIALKSNDSSLMDKFQAPAPTTPPVDAAAPAATPTPNGPETAPTGAADKKPVESDAKSSSNPK